MWRITGGYSPHFGFLDCGNLVGPLASVAAATRSHPWAKKKCARAVLCKLGKAFLEKVSSSNSLEELRMRTAARAFRTIRTARKWLGPMAKKKFLRAKGTVVEEAPQRRGIGVNFGVVVSERSVLSLSVWGKVRPSPG